MRWVFGSHLALAVILGLGLAVMPFLPDRAEQTGLSETGAEGGTGSPAAGALPHSEGMTASPANNPIGQTVQLTATGLPPSSGMELLAGLDLSDMRPLDQVETNEAGELVAEAMIPDWAVPGQVFYFAVRVADDRLASVGVNVAPGAAVGDSRNQGG
jgi:hypothetical protein